MNKKILLLPLCGALLLGSCAGTETPSSVSSVVEESSISSSVTSVETEKDILDNLANKLKAADSAMNTLLQGDSLGIKSVSNATFSFKTTEIDVKGDFALTAAMNADLKNIRAVYEKMQTSADEALTQVGSDKSETYFDINLDITNDGEKETILDLTGFLTFKEGKAYVNDPSDENNPKSIVTLGDDSLYAFFAPLGQFATLFTTESESFIDTTIGYIIQLLGQMMSSETQGEVDPDTDPDIVTETPNMIDMTKVMQIFGYVASYLNGLITSTELVNNVYDLVKPESEGPLNGKIATFLSAILDYVKNIDYGSFVDVTYSENTYSFALNLDNILNTAKAFVNKVDVLSTALMEDESDLTAGSLGHQVEFFVEQAKVFLNNTELTNKVAKASIKLEDNKITIGANVDVSGKYGKVNVAIDSETGKYTISGEKAAFEAKLNASEVLEYASSITMPAFDKTGYVAVNYGN